MNLRLIDSLIINEEIRGAINYCHQHPERAKDKLQHYA